MKRRLTIWILALTLAGAFSVIGCEKKEETGAEKVKQGVSEKAGEGPTATEQDARAAKDTAEEAAGSVKDTAEEAAGDVKDAAEDAAGAVEGEAEKAAGAVKGEHK